MECHVTLMWRFFAGAKTGEVHWNSTESHPKNPLEACHVEAIGKKVTWWGAKVDGWWIHVFFCLLNEFFGITLFTLLRSVLGRMNPPVFGRKILGWMTCWAKFCMIGCETFLSPFPAILATRIFTCLVANSCNPSFTTVIGECNPKYNSLIL